MSSAYDSYNYQSYWKDRNYEHKSEAIAIESFLKKIPNKIRTIDIGCGFGRLAPLYLIKSKSVTLVDSSERCLCEAKIILGKDKKIRFIKSRAEDISQKTGKNKFDLALFIRVMHHIKNPDEVIASSNKILNENGFFIIEFANKLHVKAIINNFRKGNFTFPLEIFPQDKRTKKNINKKSIPFLNFHPDSIKRSLKKNGFKIIEVRSVSNARSRTLKKFLPYFVIIGIEKILQKPLAKIYFGPSIFILAQKK